MLTPKNGRNDGSKIKKLGSPTLELNLTQHHKMRTHCFCRQQFWCMGQIMTISNIQIRISFTSFYLVSLNIIYIISVTGRTHTKI